MRSQLNLLTLIIKFTIIWILCAKMLRLVIHNKKKKINNYRNYAKAKNKKRNTEKRKKITFIDQISSQLRP